MNSRCEQGRRGPAGLRTLERIVFGEAKDQLGLTPPQRVAALEDTIKDWI